MESNRRPRESTLIQHPTSHALLTSPTPCQRELVCGACIGTAQFGASLAAPLDSLLKQSSLRSLCNMIIILVAWPSLIVHAQIFCNSKNKRNKAGENEFTFACHLANKLDIEVLWEPFNEYTISWTPNITLATFSIKVPGLQLKIQIRGEQVSVKCLSIEAAGLISTTTGQGRLHSLQIDGQSRSPGLLSLREAITTTYGAAVWLSQLPGFPKARPGPPQEKTQIK